MRTALSLLLGTLFVTGCIFPSFDGMQGEKGSIAPRTEDDATEGNGDSSTNTGATPNDDGGIANPNPSPAADGSVQNDGASTADAGPRTIACGGATCPVGGGAFCCAGYGSCGENADGQMPCSGLGNGRVLECDDNDDCGGGQVCCYVEANKKSSCQTSCTTGAILCNAASPRCPGAMQCNGTLTTSAFTSSKCQ